MVFKLDEKPVDELLKHWEHLIKLVFPPRATVRSSAKDSGYRISVGWRLGEEPTENWSREIDVVIPRETVEDYRKMDRHQRDVADNNLVSFVKLRYGDFRPDHDTPRFRVPPAEEWVVKTDNLVTK